MTKVIMHREFQMLDARECDKIVNMVMDLHPFWDRLSEKYSYFKLGASSYIDARENADGYVKKCKEVNDILANCFSGLYDAINAELASIFNDEFRQLDIGAVPGFHIFVANSDQILGEMAPRHLDLQHLDLPWNGDIPLIDDIVSFTLPIAIPSRGTGLWIWEDEGWDSDFYFNRYRRGRLFIHSGKFWHQADIPFGMLMGEKRITLQGHCVRFNGIWHTYF